MGYGVEWVKERFEREEPIKYIFFWGHTGSSNEIGKHVFSQWFYSPFLVDGIQYHTAEHWMMSQKARLFGDQKIIDKILQARKPGEVKELGRMISRFDEAVWAQKRYEIVKTGSLHKFQQNTELGDFLVNTADRVIVEASPVDTIWGIGLSHDTNGIENPHTWKGLNLLGFALMDVRDIISGKGRS